MMGKKNKGLWLFLLAAWGCQNVSQDRLAIDAAAVAMWQCEARTLQKQGFEWAKEWENQAQTGVKQDTAVVEPLKREMYAQRAEMAEKISHLLDSLWQNTYKDLDQRRQLDVAVEAILAKKCPN